MTETREPHEIATEALKRGDVGGVVAAFSGLPRADLEKQARRANFLLPYNAKTKKELLDAVRQIAEGNTPEAKQKAAYDARQAEAFGSLEHYLEWATAHAKGNAGAPLLAGLTREEEDVPHDPAHHPKVQGAYRNKIQEIAAKLDPDHHPKIAELIQKARDAGYLSKG